MPFMPEAAGSDLLASLKSATQSCYAWLSHGFTAAETVSNGMRCIYNAKYPCFNILIWRNDTLVPELSRFCGGVDTQYTYAEPGKWGITLISPLSTTKYCGDDV